MYLFLILVMCSSSAYGQLHLSGACNFTSINYVRGLNTSFTGNWNQLERISNNNEQGECSKSQFTLTNTSINIYNSEVFNKKTRYRNGTITPKSDGILNVTFSDGSYEFAVLKTDYTTYAILYSCKNEVNNNKSVWAWKLARSTTFSTQQTHDIREVINANADLRNATWTKVAHTTEACKTSSSTALTVTPLVLFYALLVVTKGYY